MENKQNIKDLIQKFYPHAKEKLGFDHPVRVIMRQDAENAQQSLGKTAYYDPAEKLIVLYVTDRHPKDVLRSFSHELVHHAQNCRGEFAGGAATVEGYAQEDEHLRELEREAYEVGNLIFRDWEDGLKSKGGAPLFTSTHYTPPYTSDMVGGRLLEENKMKNKITESRLREIIKGVIEEMFNGDLDESLVDTNPAAFSEDAAKVELAQAASAAAGQGKDVDSALTTANENKELEESVEEEVNEQVEEEVNEQVEEEINEAADEKDDKEAEKEVNEQVEDEINEEVEDELNESFVTDRNTLRRKQREDLNKRLTKLWSK